MDFINTKKIKSWAKSYSGNYLFYQPRSIDEIKILLSKNKIISSGGFRSYGDSAIIVIINSKNFNKIINFDEQAGILRAESGITIDEMIKFLLPKG